MVLCQLCFQMAGTEASTISPHIQLPEVTNAQDHQHGQILHNTLWWHMINSKIQILPGALWSPRWGYHLACPHGTEHEKELGQFGQRATRLFKFCSALKETLLALTDRQMLLALALREKQEHSSFTFKGLHPGHEIICQDNLTFMLPFW